MLGKDLKLHTTDTFWLEDWLRSKVRPSATWVTQIFAPGVNQNVNRLGQNIDYGMYELTHVIRLYFRAANEANHKYNGGVMINDVADKLNESGAFR